MILKGDYQKKKDTGGVEFQLQHHEQLARAEKRGKNDK